MAIFTLNGVSMPAPTTMSMHLEDAVFSARRALSGEALVSRAALKRRIDAYWAYLSPENLRLLLENAAQDTPCTLTYPDPITGDMRQMTAYSTARRVDMKRMQGASPVWTGVQMTFTEC